MIFIFKKNICVIYFSVDRYAYRCYSCFSKERKPIDWLFFSLT